MRDNQQLSIFVFHLLVRVIYKTKSFALDSNLYFITFRYKRWWYSG